MLNIWVDIFARRLIFFSGQESTERLPRQISDLHRHCVYIFMDILGTGFAYSRLGKPVLAKEEDLSSTPPLLRSRGPVRYLATLTLLQGHGWVLRPMEKSQGS